MTLWMSDNERLNAGVELKIGMITRDAEGNAGVVVKIVPPEQSLGDDEDHGLVYVWQSERVGYGDDNCEHYTFTGWQSFLRIEDSPNNLAKRLIPR